MCPNIITTSTKNTMTLRKKSDQRADIIDRLAIAIVKIM